MKAEAAPLVPSALLQAVYRHAAAEYPRECCGLLLGPRGAPPDEARPCANAQDLLHAADPGAFRRDARAAFSLGLDDVRALEESLAGPRPALVLYHSHADAPPSLSAEDERLALLGGHRPAWPVLHLVVEVRAGAARAAVLHGWDPATHRFRALARYGETGAPAPGGL